jgi:hypothetical protein
MLWDGNRIMVEIICVGHLNAVVQVVPVVIVHVFEDGIPGNFLVRQLPRTCLPRSPFSPRTVNTVVLIQNIRMNALVLVDIHAILDLPKKTHVLKRRMRVRYKQRSIGPYVRALIMSFPGNGVTVPFVPKVGTIRVNQVKE